jgi:chaperone required for assembly of F1-ATPase
MTGSDDSEPVSAPEIRISSAPVVDGGFAVTVNGKPAQTPAKHPLVVPGAALVRAIADELTEDPLRLTGKGLGDPADAANFRISLGAIDLFGHVPDARAQTIGDLAAYGETDLVCFQCDAPDTLAAAQKALFGPLLDWFTATFGVSLTVTTGLRAVPQDGAALEAIRGAIEGYDDFTLAALTLATNQAERWGEDAEATRARAGKALDLAQAARFVELLALD